MIKWKNIIIIIAMSMVVLGNGCNQNEASKNIILNIDDSDIKSSAQYQNINDFVNSFPVKNDVIEPVFIDHKQFANTATVSTKEIKEYPIAGIVNHHTLAMDLQAGFFKSLKMIRPDVKTFVIVSPDHFLAGADVSTHAYPYLTQAGTVKTRALPMDGIYEAQNVRVFSIEHGVGALAPFIAREFPKAEIIPVFIRPEAGDDALINLASAIKQLMDQNVFIIVSSDMSHYLTDKQARINDQVTLRWINNNNWQMLSLANDDYTDSAKGFETMQYLFDDLQFKPKFILLDYAVSTDYGGDKAETTSYITGFFVE
jgi:AmmeMemoRadiSam system protein B